MKIVKNHGLGETLEKAAQWQNLMNWFRGNQGQPAAGQPAEAQPGTAANPEALRQEFYQLYEQHKPEFDWIQNITKSIANSPMIKNNPKHKAIQDAFALYSKNLALFENNPQELPGIVQDTQEVLGHLQNLQQYWEKTTQDGRDLMNGWVDNLTNFQSVLGQFPPGLAKLPPAPTAAEAPSPFGTGYGPAPVGNGAQAPAAPGAAPAAPAAPAAAPDAGFGYGPAQVTNTPARQAPGLQTQSPAERRKQYHGPVDKQLQKYPDSVKNLTRKQKFPTR